MIEKLTSDSEGHTRTEHFTRKEENIFYEHSFPIYNWSGASYFPPGQYSFPFSFTLDENLPGSFFYEWSSHGYSPYGKIKYKLKAGLKDPCSDVIVYDKFDIIIDQKMQMGQSYLQPPAFEKSVSGYCYTSHGRYRLAAVFSNNQFLVGDQAQMSLAVDATQAETDIKYIRAELLMRTSISAQGRSNINSNVINSVKLPGIIKGTARMNEQSIPISMNVNTMGDLQATSSGRLVNNSFYLRITAEVDGCVCYSETPFSEIPVCVYNKNYGPQSLPTMNQMVPDWAPQTFDPYMCEFNQGNRMTQQFKNDFMFQQNMEMPTG